MERFLCFSIGCLIVTGIFIHFSIVYSDIKHKKKIDRLLSDQTDWIKTLVNEVNDLNKIQQSFFIQHANSLKEIKNRIEDIYRCYKIHDEDIEDVKNIIQSLIEKNTQDSEPKAHKQNNWDSMKMAFRVPGIKVIIDE